MERRWPTLCRRGLAAGLLWAAIAGLAGAAPPADWLSLCGKCLSPTVVQKSGISTSHATAVARTTRQGAEEWCDNWQPGSKTCVREQLDSEEAHKSYRVSADCVHGQITAVDGVTYRLAGVWTSGFGKGRTKWRNPSGHVLGTDNASNGLGISQQWEVLCPGRAASLTLPQATPMPSARHPTDRFAVGQEIEARYGRDWVRGRVSRIWRHEGASGHETAYDVRLVNGKRGIIPERMLRLPAGQ